MVRDQALKWQENRYEGLTGFEIDENGHYKKDGRIRYGGLDIINEGGDKYTIIDQDFKESWTINASSERALKLKINKFVFNATAYGEPIIKELLKKVTPITRAQWDELIAKRDQAIKESGI